MRRHSTRWGRINPDAKSQEECAGSGTEGGNWGRLHGDRPQRLMSSTPHHRHTRGIRAPFVPHRFNTLVTHTLILSKDVRSRRMNAPYSPRSVAARLRHPIVFPRDSGAPLAAAARVTRADEDNYNTHHARSHSRPRPHRRPRPHSRLVYHTFNNRLPENVRWRRTADSASVSSLFQIIYSYTFSYFLAEVSKFGKS